MEKNETAFQSQDLLQKINTLPGLPAIVMKIRKVLASPDASAKDVEQVIKMDPVITGRILKLANSAYIGLPRSVSSLKNAVVILGRQRIYSLIMGSSVFSLFKRDGYHSFTGINFWKHSVIVALVAESIAAHSSRRMPIDSGEVFTAGILHDIGKLVLGVFDPERMAATYRRAIETGTAFYMNETEHYAHTVLGSLVAEKWNFPSDLVNAILYHHTPQRDSMSKRCVRIIYVADVMAHVLGINTVPQECVPSLDEEIVSHLGLEPEALRAIAHGAIEHQKRMESFIDFIS